MGISNSKTPTQDKNKDKNKDENKKTSLHINKAYSYKMPEWVLKGYGINEQEYKLHRSLQILKDKKRTKEARKIIQNSIIEAQEVPDIRFPLAISISNELLDGYATLDDLHREDISKLKNSISDYLKDSTRKRPLNALMIASPGAGKSHFINQLSTSMKEEHLEAVTFNMATMQTTDDLAEPVDELRNLKVNDQYPLLFLDEFDSDPSRYPALLPLLWDGELQIGSRDLKLGKAVIVLAGSNPDLPKAMDQSAKMRIETDTTEIISPPNKLVDLLSRINGGVITIPDLDFRSATRDRRVDKVCIAVALLKKRFGNQINEVPRSLLRFIAHTTFRYGVRSIDHLIDLISIQAFKNNSLNGEKLTLPIESEKELQKSSLKLHCLDKDQCFGIVNRWIMFSKDKVMVKLRDPISRFYRY